jgi:hypothetical protein
MSKRGTRSLALRFLTTALVATLFTGCPPMSELIDDSPQNQGTGIMGAGIVRAMIIIAKYNATEKQRKVAEANARRAVAALTAATQPPATPKPGTTTKPAPPRRTKVPKFIAVDTVPDEHSQTTRPIMIWNTQTQEFVGDTVYEVKEPPKLGQTAQFDTHIAEYVGAGL